MEMIVTFNWVDKSIGSRRRIFRIIRRIVAVLGAFRTFLLVFEGDASKYRDYSHPKVVGLLEDSLLEATAWSRALYAPPWGWANHRRIASVWEEIGEYAWPGLGGVILAEAVKHTGAVRPRGQTAPVRPRALEGQGQPALSPRQLSGRHRVGRTSQD